MSDVNIILTPIEVNAGTSHPLPALDTKPLGTLPVWMLPNYFLQERQYIVSDGGGGFSVENWDIINENLRGFLRGAAPSPSTRGAKHMAELSHMFYCLPDTDILRGDRLTIIKEGVTIRLQVIGINNPALMEHHLEVPCKEWQPGITGLGNVEDEA